MVLSPVRLGSVRRLSHSRWLVCAPQSDLEEASGYKGQFNTNVLESRLEEALAHLVVVSLSGTLRRPNDDTIAIRQAIDRIESVV